MPHKHLFQYWELGSHFNKQLPAFVSYILQMLNDHGHESYVVGGAIRDIILGRKPKDFDIVTSATPTEIKGIFRRSARIIGRRFKIVHIVDKEGTIYEVSTFRRSPTLEERQGRFSEEDDLQIWNDNYFGTLEDDIVRRDFPVNALYYTPRYPDSILDFVGGLQDIAQRRLRTLGDPQERIQEDPVRILRALKLIAQFDFKPVPELEKTLIELAPTICNASQARLSEELRKISQQDSTYATFQTFIKYQFLPHYWNEFYRTYQEPGMQVFYNYIWQQRDKKISAGNYTLSKSLACATMAFPYVAFHIGKKSLFKLSNLHRPKFREALYHTICDFYDNLMPPKFIVMRATDIIQLMCGFLNGVADNYILSHKEYKYARELFLLLHSYYSLDEQLKSIYPPAINKPRNVRHNQSEAPKKKKKNHRRRKKTSKTTASTTTDSTTGPQS